MNLKELFQMQRQLDQHIEEKHPRENGEDRLAKKILALQVELGELANEQRSWKFWSRDQKPRVKVLVEPDERNPNAFKNPLLEEYVDCLHFILSIGLEEYEYRVLDEVAMLPVNRIINFEPIKYESITKQFNYLFNQVGYFYDCTADHEFGESSEVEEQYEFIYRMFIGLGEMLGFTQEQIEEAYMEKNATNYARQENGY
ncbi:dUTP diphosphatase [Bacillus badius]|nr:dUTP diphosphatase [Bacillus badius]UAT32640.1 dUTP diphosphatase [Bacillus badius]